MTVIIHCDGLCQPNNPGGYACWAWIVTDGPAAQGFGCVARGNGATNNIAEYAAVEKALLWCLDNHIDNPLLRTDSQLVVQQVNAEWRCNSPHLIPLRDRVQTLLATTNGQIEWVPRTLNEVADALSRHAYALARQGSLDSSDTSLPQGTIHDDQV